MLAQETDLSELITDADRNMLNVISVALTLLLQAERTSARPKDD